MWLLTKNDKQLSELNIYMKRTFLFRETPIEREREKKTSI